MGHQTQNHMLPQNTWSKLRAGTRRIQLTDGDKKKEQLELTSMSIMHHLVERLMSTIFIAFSGLFKQSCNKYPGIYIPITFSL